MIGYLKGEIIDIEENTALIDVNNIGFKVMMPSYDLYDETEGNEITVFTYLNVKEDALDLYGSKDKRVMELFKKLIEVSGIGPKTAMTMLSKFDVNDLICAIINADAKLISTCPGIGLKTAERAVLELKDKLIKQGENLKTSKTKTQIKNEEENSQVKDEAYEALINLGYKRQDAKQIIEKVYEEGMTIEEVIKKALIR